MARAPLITSPQNAKIKQAAGLRDRKARQSEGLFAAEGAREIERALGSDFQLHELFVAEDMFSEGAKDVVRAVSGQPGGEAKLIGVSAAAFSKLAMRESSDGLYAVFKSKRRTLQDIELSAHPLFLVCEGVEKPGNLGALLRSADGAGADALIVIGSSSVDSYNPNVIRASLGTIFTVPVIEAELDELGAFFQRHEINVFAASPDAEKCYFEVDMRGPTALVLGSEASGLSPFWRKQGSLLTKIPMMGIADSLNVSVAGALMLYEARRQRFRLPS